MRDLLFPHLCFEEVGHHGLRLIERHIDTGFCRIVKMIIPETDIFHFHTVVANHSPVRIIEKVGLTPEANRVCGGSGRDLTKTKVLDRSLNGGHHFKNVGVVKHRSIVEQTLLAGRKLIIASHRITL